jgi:PKD repeat protein
VSHTYSADGGYNVRLIVNSSSGLADTIFTTATVANVAPAIAAFAGATLLPGETYAATGSFTDPGTDAWTATVDYGDGSGLVPLALAGKTFALSHTFAGAGSFTITVRVRDDDVTSTRTATVTVLTPEEGIDKAIAIVNELLADGKIDAGIASSLTSKLGGAKTSLLHETTHAALGKLEAVLDELDALIHGGHVSASDVDALHELVERVIKSIT